MIRTQLRLAAGLALLGLVGACAAQPQQRPPGDPEVGRKEVQALCSGCHSIEKTGDSPNPAAPPLRHILSQYNPRSLANDLENAVHIAHKDMPQFFLADQHGEDIVAYLVTIQDKASDH